MTVCICTLQQCMAMVSFNPIVMSQKVTGFAKGLIHAITSIIVTRKGVELHLWNSPPLYSCTRYFNGRLAEVPAILDRFFTSITSTPVYRVAGRLTVIKLMWGSLTEGLLNLDITIESCGHSQPVDPLLWPFTEL